MKKVKLGDLLLYEQPTKYLVESDMYDDSYDVPVLTAGKSFLLGYTDETENIFEKVPVIIFDDFTTATQFVDFPFKVKSSAMKILNCNYEKADIRYMFYLLQTIKIDSERHKRYWISQFAEMEIPLPSLDIQKSIAAQLDKADELIQYNRQLLEKYDELQQSLFLDMFGDPVVNERGWEIGSFGEEFKISSGGTPSTKISEYWENGTIPWIGSNMCKNDILYTNDGKFITKLGFENSAAKIFESGSVLVALVGATIGKTALLEFSTATNQNIAGIDVKNSKHNPYYVYYTLQNLYDLFMNIGSGKFKMANLSFVRNIEFPKPPLSLQNEFASHIASIEYQKGLVKDALAKSEDIFNGLLQEHFSS